MTKTKTRFLTVGLAVIVLLTAALFVIPSLGTTADAAWDGTTIAGTFAEGKGTQDDPYQIANGEQLAYLAQQVNNDALSSDGYFVLTDDIDLGSKKWTPIGSDDYVFWGIFNGNGYTISNLKSTVYNGYTGLFGSNSGTIRNGHAVLRTCGYCCGKRRCEGKRRYFSEFHRISAFPVICYLWSPLKNSTGNSGAVLIFMSFLSG